MERKILIVLDCGLRIRNTNFIKVVNFENVARLAQSVERKALNLVVVGSTPTVGVPFVFI